MARTQATAEWREEKEIEVPESEPNEFRIMPAWHIDDPAIKRDAINFWNENQVLPPDAIPEARVKELVLVAYDKDKVAGLGSAEVFRLTGTRHDFASCRVYVAAPYRRMSLGRNITGFTFDIVEEWAKNHPEEGVAGVVSIWESRAQFFDGKAPPIWDYGLRMQPAQDKAPLVLWGYRTTGEEIYFRWFDHILV